MTSPLSGIRVVSIALNVPGPVAASRLRQAGAAVTKVEPPSGDPLAHYAPDWYRELHHDVAVERIDLKSASGKTRLDDLLVTADLLLTSQRPAALRRLGLDADTLFTASAPSRHLRWLNIVGDTSAPDVAGHDLTYLAEAGLLGTEVPRSVFADIVAAECAFSRALLLLREPPGAHSIVGIADSLAPLAAAQRHGLTGPGGLLGGKLAAYGVYAAREGRVAVAALEPHFRQRLYQELELPIDSGLADVFVSRTADEWEIWARARDLPLVKLR